MNPTRRAYSAKSWPSSPFSQLRALAHSFNSLFPLGRARQRVPRASSSRPPPVRQASRRPRHAPAIRVAASRCPRPKASRGRNIPAWRLHRHLRKIQDACCCALSLSVCGSQSLVPNRRGQLAEEIQKAVARDYHSAHHHDRNQVGEQGVVCQVLTFLAVQPVQNAQIQVQCFASLLEKGRLREPHAPRSGVAARQSRWPRGAPYCLSLLNRRNFPQPRP
jgi:hypothetical protein